MNGGDHPFTIGDDDSNVSVDGRVLSLSGDIDVNGKNIHIYEGTNKNQYVVLTHTNRINLGGDTTENLQLDGGFCAQGPRKVRTAVPKAKISLSIQLMVMMP